MESGKFSNQNVAKLLRSVAAALTLKKALPAGRQVNLFQIRAYETAADSIEHLDSEIKDIWAEGKLDEVPGIGKNLHEHLNELFKTGKVKHFESLKKNFPPVLFDLLDIPGIGPKTAQEIAEMGIKNLQDLKEKIKSGELVKKGFSGKIAEKIMLGMEEISGRDGRMLLPYAYAQAQKILEYLKKSPDVKDADPLGSLRRQVATIGDLDFAASSSDPKKVVDYFVKMNGVTHVSGQGENKATVTLSSGLHIDLLVGKPETYGALLQHFTGSKNHNIKLRKLALEKGYSLSEYGVKKVKNNEILQCKSEEDLYKMLGMQIPPPEIREDTGEIEAALKNKLPKLVDYNQIKGDLHTHSNFPMEHPSHGPGANSIEEIIKKAVELKYQFIGVSDHPPGFTATPKAEMIKTLEKRTKFIQKLKQGLPAGRQGTKSIRVQYTESGLSTHNIQILNGLEVDILGDGSLGVPDEILQTLDYCIAGIHSGHRGSKEQITKRLLKALENPNVDIISHPTNRLLNERESSDADWEEIFKFCAKSGKLLEINAYPNRLDLRDDLVRQALGLGCKFIINTDAHEVSQMDNMKFGVAVARRGWAEGRDIVNTWEWTKFAKWFNLK